MSNACRFSQWLKYFRWSVLFLGAGELEHHARPLQLTSPNASNFHHYCSSASRGSEFSSITRLPCVLLLYLFLIFCSILSSGSVRKIPIGQIIDSLVKFYRFCFVETFFGLIMFTGLQFQCPHFQIMDLGIWVKWIPMKNRVHSGIFCAGCILVLTNSSQKTLMQLLHYWPPCQTRKRIPTVTCPWGRSDSF